MLNWCGAGGVPTAVESAAVGKQPGRDRRLFSRGAGFTVVVRGIGARAAGIE